MKACPSMRAPNPKPKLVDASAPRVPIPGNAGKTIYEALSRMATHAGEMTITISKSRVAGGGYAYSIARNNSPVNR